MLVLTRKVLKPSNPQETIVLRCKKTGAILAKIGVMKSMTHRTKLGIDADDDVEIIRGENLEDGQGEIITKPGVGTSTPIPMVHGQGETKQSA